MADNKNEFTNLLPKIIHTILIFLYVFRGLGREVCKLGYGWRSKMFVFR